MLNMNSPTVQAMMQNVPQGIGNMPVYYGNTPVVTSEQQTPYPSPKEMLMQTGEQNIYTPTSMQPSLPYFNATSQYGNYYNPYIGMQQQQQYVGGYNPGYNAAFSGYVNPYMGYGYSGFGYGAVPVNQFVSEEQKHNQMLADENGVDYDEQLRNESELYKKMVRLAGQSTGMSEEEIQKAEAYYEPYKKTVDTAGVRLPYYFRTPIQHLQVVIDKGDGIEIEINNTEVENYMQPRELEVKVEQNFKMKESYQKCYQDMYNAASERKADSADLVDFFNNYAARIMMESLENRVRLEAMTMSSRMYNSEKFLTLLKNNGGLKTKAQERAITKLIGRYGVMPNGEFVSPSHNPAVAQSFTMDPRTGQLEITAPNFIRDRLEKARTSFIRSIDE